MPVDNKKLLQGLLNLDVNKVPPTGSHSNFAQYMSGASLGMPVSPKELGLASQANEDTRGIMGKTFGWMSSLGNMVENVFLDSVENEGALGGIGDAARDVGAGVLGFLQPALEATVNVPGIQTPWEDKISDFIYKYNYQHEGTGPVSGARILESAGVDNPIGKYGGGFAIDVLTDPLTYLGVGLAKIPGKAKSAVEAVNESAATGKAYAAVQAGREAAQGKFIQDSLPKFRIKEVNGKTTTELPSAIPGIINAPAPRIPGIHADLTPIKAKVNISREFDPVAELELARLGKIPSATRPVNVEGLPKLNFGQEQFARKSAKQSTDVIHKGGINQFAVREVMENVIQGRTARMAPSVAPAVGSAADVAVANADQLVSLFGKGRIKKELNPANQANLYNRMFKATAKLPEISSQFKGLHSSKAALAWRRQTALAMVKTAEDYLASSKGINGVGWDGAGIRLSDVVSELGTKSLDEYIPQILDVFRTGNLEKATNPAVKTALETAIGRRAAQTGTVTKALYDDFSKSARQVENLYSPAAYDAWKIENYKKLREAAYTYGFTSKEADKVVELLKNHTGIDELDNMDPFDVIDRIGTSMAKATLEGKVDQKALAKIGKAITRQVGAKPGETSLDLLQNKVGDWFWHNMTTWMGRGFMMPKYRSEISLANYRAKARADWIGKMMKDHSAEEIDRAFALAQDPLRNVEDSLELFGPKTAALAAQFRDYMDNMKFQMQRSQMIPQDINKHLKAIGSEFRFDEKNAAWLDSWRKANPQKWKQNPAIFLYNLDLAMQRTHAEYNLLDMFRTEFGKAADEAGFDRMRHTHSLGVATHRIPNDVKFDRDVANQFKQLLQDFEKGQWRPSSKLTQVLTTALRKWKSSVTIYYPAHHIRNLIGDSWLMWIAGHNDPRAFLKAQRVIGSQRKRYAEAIGDPDFATLEKFLDPSTAGWAQTEGRSIITKKYGSNVSADEIYGEAIRRGLLVDASRIEDLQGNTIKVYKDQFKPHPVLERIGKPLGGRGHNAASTVAEVREHYVRMAHLISYVEKHMGRELGSKLAKESNPVARAELMKKLFDDAAMEIRKYHPDGTDMSFFEQKYLRNIMPFYSWTRKAIPLTLEAMMLRPAKVTAYPRAMYAIQGALGINAPGGMSNPFPDDQLFPDWMQATGIGPIGDPESDNPFAKFFGQLGRNQIDPFGNEIGYTNINPGQGALPPSMVGQMLGMGDAEGVKKGVFDSLTPLINIPTNLISGRTNTGAPIPSAEGGEGYASYAMGQVPQLSPFQRLFGIGKEGQQNAEPGFNMEAFVNMLTALGIQGSGKYTKAAQFQARE